MIDLQRIETFLYVAEKLSISEAAKRLHLSQPTVSHQIKLLEQELNNTLFVRSNMGLQLTEADYCCPRRALKRHDIRSCLTCHLQNCARHIRRRGHQTIFDEAEVILNLPAIFPRILACSCRSRCPD